MKPSRKPSNPSLLIIIFVSLFLSNCKNSKDQPVSQNESITIIENPPWATTLIKAYEALDKDGDIASADLLFEATGNMPKKNWENYVVCATIYAPNGETDKAFEAIDEALETGLRDSELLNSIPDFTSLREDSRWKTLIAKTENKRIAYIEAIENPQLLELLEELWAADQAALARYEEKRALLDSTSTSEDDDRLFEPVVDRWETNKNNLDSIIEIHGWPGNKLVGEDGAKIAWAIPQHHPDVFFKEKCLSLIKKAVEEGDFDPNHFAELTDRIARATWQKQTYGASIGQEAPYPIENPSHVNQRRFALGLLEPIEVYAYYHGITYELPSVKEANLKAKTSFKETQLNYSKFEQFLKVNEIDSALSSIKKSINSYGDLSNEQLYEASLKLSDYPDERSKKLGLKIVEVLIWRKWNKRFDAIKQDSYATLDNEDWAAIEALLKQSN